MDGLCLHKCHVEGAPCALDDLASQHVGPGDAVPISMVLKRGCLWILTGSSQLCVPLVMAEIRRIGDLGLLVQPSNACDLPAYDAAVKPSSSLDSSAASQALRPGEPTMPRDEDREVEPPEIMEGPAQDDVSQVPASACELSYEEPPNGPLLSPESPSAGAVRGFRRRRMLTPLGGTLISAAVPAAAQEAERPGDKLPNRESFGLAQSTLPSSSGAGFRRKVSCDSEGPADGRTSRHTFGLDHPTPQPTPQPPPASCAGFRRKVYAPVPPQDDGAANTRWPPPSTTEADRARPVQQLAREAAPNTLEEAQEAQEAPEAHGPFSGPVSASIFSMGSLCGPAVPAPPNDGTEAQVCRQRSTSNEGQPLGAWLFVASSAESASRAIAAFGQQGAIRPDFDDHYNLESKCLGTGVSAAVRWATSKHSHLGLAVKCFKTKDSQGKSDRAAALRTMRDEVAKLVILQGHPNIVQFHGLFQIGGLDQETPDGAAPLCSLAMELCAGDLMAAQGHRRFSEEGTRPMMQGILSGLRHVHSFDYVHRDVKPPNIMLRKDGTCLLADFGLACSAMETERLMKPCGSPGFCAPEIVQRHGCCKESDVWSVGATLYYMLCRKLAFGGTDKRTRFLNSVYGTLAFDHAPFETVSADCKAYLCLLLTKTPRERLDADGALQHSWFQTKSGSKEAMRPQVSHGLDARTHSHLHLEEPQSSLADHIFDEDRQTGSFSRLSGSSLAARFSRMWRPQRKASRGSAASAGSVASGQTAASSSRAPPAQEDRVSWTGKRIRRLATPVPEPEDNSSRPTASLKPTAFSMRLMRHGLALSESTSTAASSAPLTTPSSAASPAASGHGKRPDRPSFGDPNQEPDMQVELSHV